jgi:hypothetical protein
MTSLLTLAQNAASSGGSPVVLVIQLAVVILTIAGLWKVFEKAGQPGWAAIVPVYNLFILCKLAGKPAWWVVLFLVPVVNLIALAVVSMEVAKAFGKTAAFGVGLFLLGFIFYPMLAFTDAQYRAPGAPASPAADARTRAAA